MSWRAAIGYSFDLACLTGVVLVGIGLGQIYGPLAWVFAGLVLSAGGVFGAKLFAKVHHPRTPEKAKPEDKEPEEPQRIDYVDAAPEREVSFKEFFGKA